MRISISMLLVLAAAGTQLGNTNCGEVIRDSGFDLWCDGTLCAWKVERGTIAQVPTWTQGDSGVQLVGADTAIEQLSPVNDNDGGGESVFPQAGVVCIEFDLVANIDDDAEVDLDIDIDDNGTIDSSERLPTSHWQPLTYKLPIAPPFDGIRFELVKSGTGNAVLAQIKANVVDDCGGLAPIIPGPAPNGASCTKNSECGSALCSVSFGSYGVCVGCDESRGGAACSGGAVCGLDDPSSPLLIAPIECVPAAARALGDSCDVDGECETSVCNGRACSTCRTDADCGAGSTCGPGWDTPIGLYAPTICNPGAHRGTPGEACTTNADCASNSCAGKARSECADGRACADASACPFDSGLMNGACTAVGIQGGSCD